MYLPKPSTKYDSPTRSDMLKVISNEFEISNRYIEKMKALIDYDIVFVMDDSGSMRTQSNHDNHSSRWDELKYITNIAIRLGVIFDDNGIDIQFLNRTGLNNVISFEQIEPLFRKDPYGLTPLTKVVSDIFQQYQNNDKPVLLVIVTDGLPTNQYAYPDIHQFNTLITNTNHNFNISFLTWEVQDDFEDLNILEKNIPNVNTLDDYISELNKVQLIKGTKYKYSFGDHVARLLLRPICYDLDILDECKIKHTHNCRGCGIL